MKKIILVLVASVLIGGPVHATTNKQLTMGTEQEFDNLNPLIAQQAATFYMVHMYQRTLTTIDADWRWICALCVTMPTFENGLVKKVVENGKEKLLVTWEINPKAKWGDGVPVTGEDIKFSWQVGISPDVAVGEKEVYDRVEVIQVNPKNPKQFTMKFKEPRYDFYQLGTFYIVPKHLEEKIFNATKGQMGVYEKQTNFVTNPTLPGLYDGPYMVSEVKLGSHVMLIPNPSFYGEKPKIQKIVCQLISSSQALEANIRSGAIDMISETASFMLDQALSMQKRATPADPFLVQFRDGSIYEHIDLNLRNPLLQDVRVRKALLYGADREKLTQALFEGKQKVALHIMHPLDTYYYTEDVVLYPYSPDKAKQLLEEAGWKMGPDGIRQKEGKKLTFTLMSTAQNKTRELVEVFLQNEWKKIGVEINIKNQPARVFFGATIRKGPWPDMGMFAWISSPDNVPLSTMHSKNIPSAANGFNGQNWSAYKNVKVDRILDATLKEFDPAKRKQMMRDALYVSTDDAATVPLYYRSDLAVVPKNLKNFRITGHQFYSTENIEKWDLGD